MLLICCQLRDLAVSSFFRTSSSRCFLGFHRRHAKSELFLLGAFAIASDGVLCIA